MLSLSIEGAMSDLESRDPADDLETVDAPLPLIEEEGASQPSPISTTRNNKERIGLILVNLLTALSVVVALLLAADRFLLQDAVKPNPAAAMDSQAEVSPESISSESNSKEAPPEVALSAALPLLDLEAAIGRKAMWHTTIPTRPRTNVITYTVQSGDSLFSIASQFGIKPETVLWGNYETLQNNPHLLKVGQVLNILPVDGTYYQWHEGDRLSQVAEFFNGKEPGLYGMAFRAQRGIYFASGWLTLVYNFGDGFIDQKNWTSRMDQPDVAQSLDYFVKLLNTCPPDVLNYTHEEATSAFVSGKTAMWYDATALVPWLEDPSRSQIVGKIGYTPPPPGPAGDGGVLAGWNMALSADTKNKEAAWAFIVYMTSKANAKTYISYGGVPSRISSLEDPEFQASNPSAEAQLGAFAAADALVQRGLSWIPQTPVVIKALDRVGYYGSSVAAGEMEIAEAMQQAHEEVSAILSEVSE